MKNVIIVYRFLPQYRIEFYNGLRKVLALEGVNLDLVYGKASKADALKKDEVNIDWAKPIPSKTINIGNTELLWQPCLPYLKNKDLIIVEGANKLLLNYCLMFVRHLSKFKLGVWGHGRNLQAKENSTRNKFKELFLKKCDYYFAYTAGVKNYLLKQGLPENKVVVVQNAIETGELKSFYDNINESEIEGLRSELGIYSTNVGIYCSGMYPEKRIPFLLDACRKVKEAIPDFHMIFIGSGVHAHLVKDAVEQHDWVHYVGPKFGLDRVKYFKIATLQLMPGLVGLGVLDSFVMKAPLITTKYEFHSPEIEYLENGVNGFITENTFEDYTQTIIEVLSDKKYIDLVEGCNKATEKYTMNVMIENFKNGILKSLK